MLNLVGVSHHNGKWMDGIKIGNHAGCIEERKYKRLRN